MNREDKEKYINNVRNRWFVSIMIILTIAVFIGSIICLSWLFSWLDQLFDNWPLIVFFSLLGIIVVYIFYSTLKAIKYSKELKNSNKEKFSEKE